MKVSSIVADLVAKRRISRYHFVDMATVEMNLAGQVAMVSGGGRGIGASVAEVLARAGAAVGVCDIDATAAAAGAGEVGTTAEGRRFPSPGTGAAANPSGPPAW